MRALLLAGVVATGFPGVASAAFIYDFEQVGQDVVVTGSGTLDVKALQNHRPGTVGFGLDPNDPYIALGSTVSGNADADVYVLNVPTTSFGGNTISSPSSSSGDFVGNPFPSNLVVPTGYVSGSPLLNTSTFSAATFASLGLTQGTYTYSFGAGADVDTFTVQVGPVTAVPEPASLILLGVGMAGIAAARRRKAG